jgi:hypothetical protein
MAVGSSLLATIRTEPPQWMHVPTWMLKTRLRRCAKGHRATALVGGAVVGRFGRVVVGYVRRWTFAAPGGCELRAQLRVRRKDALKPGQVRTQWRHQRREFGDDKSAGLPIWTTAGRPLGGAQGNAPSSTPAQTPPASCRSSTAS